MQTIMLYFGVLRRLVQLMIFDIFTKYGQQKLQNLYGFFNPKSDYTEFPIDPHILPKTDAFELLHNDIAKYEQVDECGFGHTTEFELKVISNLVKQYNPKKIFEIGTFKGRTTLNMAINSGEDTQIFTLDLPSEDFNKAKLTIEAGEAAYVKKEQSGERFLNHPASHKIKQLFGDSATFDFMPYQNQIDLVFIDASHSYDYVLNDSLKVLSLMKKGGVILWHDYTNWSGVRDALNHLYETNPAFKQIKHIGGTSIAIGIF